jgi:hypothetical protein
MLRTPCRSSGRRAISREDVREQRHVRRALRSGAPGTLFRQLWALGPGGDKGRPQPRVCTELFIAAGSVPGTLQQGVQNSATVIPRNASMAFLVAAGGGGSGGAGHTGATGTNKTGGGGGGTGGISLLLISTAFLPRTLYPFPASAPTTTSGAGLPSIIYDANSDSAIIGSPSQVLVGFGGGVGGLGGTTVAGAAGAAGIAMAATGQSSYIGNGNFTAHAGQAGGAGGTDVPGAGVSVTWGATGLLFSGGAGGGSASSSNAVSAGGNITSAGLMRETLTGGAGNASAGNGGAGPNGITLSLSILGLGLMATGGAGGGGNATGHVGGAGGNGSWCSGGGGGGCGVTGGTGGIGGAGFIYMCWW